MIDVTSEEYALYLEILSQIDHPFEDIMEESQISHHRKIQLHTFSNKLQKRNHLQTGGAS